MELNKKNIEKIRTVVSIKEQFNVDQKSFWEPILKSMEIPENIVETLMNSKYSTSYLIQLINKIENSEGCDSNERQICDIINDFIFIKHNKFDFDVIRQKVRNDYNDIEIELKKYNIDEKIVFDNQKIAASTIIDLFLKGKKAISLVALPQVGKTGVFRYVTFLAMTHIDDSKIYFPEDIFIITGLSDNDWQKQTEKDMFNCIKNNVYHLGKIKEFHKIIDSKRNTKILIIIDECQIATSNNLQIDKIIKDLESKAVDKNIDIKYLVVSATPSVIKYDLDKWGDKHELVILEPSNKYVSFQTFIDEKRLHEADDLSYRFLDENFLPLLKDLFTNPKYHIIRLSEKKRPIFIEWCKKYNYITTPLDCTHPTHDNLFLEEPIKHTFIIIKGFWRAGKRMKDKHVGIVYEYNNKKNINITAQGLIARFCGNDKLQNILISPHFFCNTETLKEYIEFIKKECNFHLANYTSDKLKVKDGEILKAKPSFVNNFSKDLNKNKDKLIEDTDYIDVPVEIKVDDNTFNELLNNAKNEISKDAEQVFMKFLLTNQNNNEIKIIFNKIKDNKMTKAKFTLPDPDNKENYKRHIIDTRNCMNRKGVCKTDIGEKNNFKNVWAGFIDKNQKSILLILYYGERRLNLRKKPTKTTTVELEV